MGVLDDVVIASVSFCSARPPGTFILTALIERPIRLDCSSGPAQFLLLRTMGGAMDSLEVTYLDQRCSRSSCHVPSMNAAQRSSTLGDSHAVPFRWKPSISHRQSRRPGCARQPIARDRSRAGGGLEPPTCRKTTGMVRTGWRHERSLSSLDASFGGLELRRGIALSRDGCCRRHYASSSVTSSASRQAQTGPQPDEAYQRPLTQRSPTIRAAYQRARARASLLSQLVRGAST